MAAASIGVGGFLGLALFLQPLRRLLSPNLFGVDPGGEVGRIDVDDLSSAPNDCRTFYLSNELKLEGTRVIDRLNSDFELLGIAWLENGRDLQLDVCLPTGARATLLCTYAMGLQLELSFNDNEARFPFSADASFRQYGIGTWDVQLDFAHNGHIRLTTNEVTLTIASDS